MLETNQSEDDIVLTYLAVTSFTQSADAHIIPSDGTSPPSLLDNQ